MEKFYITTTLPYVNAEPHIGFALEIIQADVIARKKRQEGKDVVFNTGTDEHGLKIYQRALAEKKEPQAYVDEYAVKFDNLKHALNLSYTNFIRTTDPYHVAAAQAFWRRCALAGDITKKVYKVKYCVGCELEKTDSELNDGRCPLHPQLTLEVREEENYFFAFSHFGERLLAFYKANPDFVVPHSRLHEIESFVATGLSDFSISRLKEKMPWGVPVPDDENQVMYVWFDALVNYISTLGWPEDEKNFSALWPGVQIAGKDNLRQQSAMWVAMLLSAGLQPPKQIYIHGFITANGQKISKSAGNTVDPFDLVSRFGTDAVRYFLLREMHPYEDGDYTEVKFQGRYNADLANGLGNFAARTTTLASKFEYFEKEKVSPLFEEKITEARGKIDAALQEYRFHEALAAIWELVSFGDGYVNETKPWSERDEAKRKNAVFQLIILLDNIAGMLEPFLPETAKKISAGISWHGEKLIITKLPILFPRLSVSI